MKTVRIPEKVHKRLEERKEHDNQPYYEVIEGLLEETGMPDGEELVLRAASFLIRRGAEKVAVFGSRVKGEAGPTSDLDLLVRFSEGVEMSLFDHARMEVELGEILGVDVDIVKEGQLETLPSEMEVIYGKRG